MHVYVPALGPIAELTWTTEFAAEAPRQVLIAATVKVVLILSGVKFGINTFQ